MKILIITTTAGEPWGGSEVLWSRVANLFLDEGHKVVVSVFDWGIKIKNIEDLEKRGAVILKRSRINYKSLPGKIKGKIISKTIYQIQLNKLLKHKPDVVLFSQGAAFDLIIPAYKNFISKIKVPYFCYLSLNTEYEILPLEKLYAQRAIFQNAVNVFFPSFRNLETARRQLCSNLDNGIVINNPPTFLDFSPTEYPDDNILNFAMVARLDAYVKGHPIVLNILSSDFWKDKSWHLNIYGKGEDLEYIMELINFYKLHKKVSIKGQVSDIKKDIWKFNHVLLMPSQYEGCPISLYDAALCGRTAVVSNVGGCAEFVEDNINGFVAEAPSVNSFGNAMKRCWEYKSQLNQFGAKSREKAMSVLNLYPEKVIVEYLKKAIK